MDWADKTASATVDSRNYTLAEIQNKVAQALRDVQRETAEECIVIIRSATGDEQIEPWQERVIANAIRARFLKEEHERD